MNYAAWKTRYAKREGREFGAVRYAMLFSTDVREGMKMAQAEADKTNKTQWLLAHGRGFYVTDKPPSRERGYQQKFEPGQGSQPNRKFARRGRVNRYQVADNELKTITIKARDREGTLKRLLDCIKKTGNVGHSFSIIVDPEGDDTEKFGWDGDGSDYIQDVKES